MIKLKAIEEIEPKLSRCISVDSPDKLFAVGKGDHRGHRVLTHNSVAQQNIIIGCVLRPESWRFLGIDLKKVELSGYQKYSEVVQGIATQLEDALTILRFAQQTMMKRYEELEQLGENNFLDLPQKGQALMVMVDEAGELLSPSGIKSEEGKAQDELKGEAALLIGSIARLGRAAGVHLAIATQRPDAKLIAGETKANLGARVCCGAVDGTASSMILDSPEGTRIRPNPRGRIYVKIFTGGNHAQGFFAPNTWLDDYFERQGLNPDGTPKSKQTSRLAKVADMSRFEDADLDELEGVDNDSIIEQMRQAEAAGIPYDDNNEEEDIPTQSKASNEDRPQLGGNSKSNTYRHEDDWDSAMDEIQAANNS